MGLDVAVGILANIEDEEEAFYQEQFANINRVLQQHGLPQHTESTPPDTFFVQLYGYSGLHYLIRAALHLWKHNQLPAPATPDTYNDSEALSNEFVNLAVDAATPFPYEHLILHSDSDGFYLPLAFDKVLVTDVSEEVAGQAIGSSYRLKAECEALAQQLELPLDGDADFEELMHELAFLDAPITPTTPKWQRYSVESHTCFWLYKASVESIKTGAAIIFT